MGMSTTETGATLDARWSSDGLAGDSSNAVETKLLHHLLLHLLSAVTEWWSLVKNAMISGFLSKMVTDAVRDAELSLDGHAQLLKDSQHAED